MPSVSTIWLPLALLTSLATAPLEGRAAVSARPLVPDSTVMVRVGDRVVTAKDLVQAYFTSWPEFRPRNDSLGRVQFLDQLANKEVMAIVARRANRPLGFEDRLLLKQYAERVHSNVLYRRLVIDSVQVSDAEAQSLRNQYRHEKRLKRILFADQATAERVRGDLLANRISWKKAHRLYSQAKEDGAEGDIGWVTRDRFTHVQALAIFDPEPGQLSPLYADSAGIGLILVAERRPTKASGFATIESYARRQIQQHRTATRVEQINARLRQRARLLPDSANIAWASQFFKPPPPTLDERGRVQVDMHGHVPRFTPQDTGRVLARWNDGQLTLGEFLKEYRSITPLLRGAAHTPNFLTARVEAVALQPEKARLARELGLDHDPLALKLIEHRREAILVEHLFQDSIQSRIRVEPGQRRQYYDAHVAQYVTYPKVRYVSIQALNQARAESLAARLRAGERPETILREDSLRFGRSSGSFSEVAQNEEGTVFHNVLFEELRPGDVSIQLDDNGILWVLKSLAYDSGRQLSFEEADRYVAESLENMAAERLLNEFLARHKRGLKIETRPDLVMRLNFIPPDVLD